MTEEKQEEVIKKYMELCGITEEQYNIRSKFYYDIAYSMEVVGMAGTRVFLNDAGNVEVNVLSPDDCLDLMDLHRKGEKLPDNISIYNDNDEKVL